MKKLLFLLLVLSLTCYANNKPVPSKIETATIYLEGATIERIADVNLTPGEHTLIFQNLSPDIVEQSIQISGLNKATIVSLQYEVNYLEKAAVSTNYTRLETKLKNLLFEKNLLESQLSGLDEETRLLENNRKVRTETATISLEAMKELAAYYRTRTSEIEKEKFELVSMLEDTLKQIEALKKEKFKLEDVRKEKRGEITLKLTSGVALSTKLQIKYNIAVAGWFPSYDIKATEVGAPLDISYKANIYQQSGTNWDGIKVILSTGDPQTNNEKPDLTPKYLNFGHGRKSVSHPTTADVYKYNPTIRSVVGTVTDESGLPIPGVTILEKGTHNTTTSDFDGNYQIQVNGGRALLYSYASFHTLSLPIYSNTINAMMVPDVQRLNEVVIVGQGKPNGYAISEGKIYTQEDAIVKLLSGKVAGVQVTGTGGASGAGTNFIIRSKSSIHGDNQPLFIVDGVPFTTSGNYYGGGNSVTSSRFLDIDPNEIENVEILKGLSASTLYGQQGRNGVVLITTKNGKGIENVIGNYKEAGITSTSFEIKNKHSIVSNADMTVLEIDAFQLDAKFQHYTSPEINENVFLTASTDSWEKYDILAGDANIYFKGTYAGKTFINPSITTDTLEISLGIDPALVVKRIESNNYKSKSFLGTNKMVTHNFNILVKNNKQTTVNLTIEDRIPVSQNKEIKVLDVLTGNSTFNEDTGILVWNLQLKANATEQKTFGYTVKYPKNEQINL
tara:strand:+ start:8198 stop:10390 length:2193 start_codon:yes stop_codon:yes gene_type:complete